MNIRIVDKIRILVLAWAAAWRVPGKYKLLFLLNPVDATRYLEFSYLIRFLKNNNYHPTRILDVSSPLILSYILSSRGAEVCKTDIDTREEKYFRPGGPVHFQQEDATGMSFADGSFDLAYSISVIEHIHERYHLAIHEMIRVTRPGGLVYLSFPVAGSTVEEWVDFPVYSSQAERDGRIFFQYRFGPDLLEKMIQELPDNVDVVVQDVFWERWEGLYDWLVECLRSSKNSRFFGPLKSGLLNLVLGPIFFKRAPGNFKKHSSFGNVQIILKKRRG